LELGCREFQGRLWERSSLSRRVRIVVIAGAVSLALLAFAGAAILRIAPIALARETGYLASIFAPDGKSVLTIRREAIALVTGFGREFFTSPATVRLQRDRFELVSIRLPDGQATILETFPPSPLTGDSIRAYYGAIFGVPHAGGLDSSGLRDCRHPSRHAFGAHIRHSACVEPADQRLRDDVSLAGNVVGHGRRRTAAAAR
jgi:hypothetical protein